MRDLIRRRWYLVLPIAAVLAVTLVKIARQPAEKEITLKLAESTEAIYGLASVQANRVFTLKIGIASNIRRLYVSEGDSVKRGAKLVEFDDFPTMTTPIAGTVAGIYFKEGETVFPQNKVMTVIDLADRTLALDLEEQGAILVRKGQKCRVSFESLRDKAFVGEVKAIFPYENQFRALLTLKDMPPEILPGMTADVAIEVGKGKKSFFVPAAAVEAGEITVKQGGKTRRLKVQTANAAGGALELQSAELKEGDVVVFKETTAK